MKFGPRYCATFALSEADTRQSWECRRFMGVTPVKGKGRKQGWVEEAIRPPGRHHSLSQSTGKHWMLSRQVPYSGLVLSPRTTALHSCLGASPEEDDLGRKAGATLQELTPAGYLPSRLLETTGQVLSLMGI